MRTPYDQLMARMYNPETVNLHPAPWPMVKTDSDMMLQKKWCNTDCGNYQQYPYKNIPMMNASNSDGIITEGFESSDRRAIDMLRSIPFIGRMINEDDSEKIISLIKSNNIELASKTLMSKMGGFNIGIDSRMIMDRLEMIKKYIDSLETTMHPTIISIDRRRVIDMLRSIPFIGRMINEYDSEKIISLIKSNNIELASKTLMSKMGGFNIGIDSRMIMDRLEMIKKYIDSLETTMPPTTTMTPIDYNQLNLEIEKLRMLLKLSGLGFLDNNIIKDIIINLKNNDVQKVYEILHPYMDDKMIDRILLMINDKILHNINWNKPVDWKPNPISF